MNTFPNRRWLILPSELVDQIDFSQVLQKSANALRYSLDGTKTFVKYDVTIINEAYVKTFVNAETRETESYTVNAGIYGRPSIWSPNLQELDYVGILELLSTSEWSNTDPSIEPQLINQV
jgi:hypothetical protein